MTMRRAFIAIIACLLVCSPGVGAARAQSSNQPDLYKAYYLEHQVKDFAAARKLYEKVAEADVSSDVRRAIRAGLDRCRDHLAAEDFAKLMPDNAVAYFEIKRPGQIIEQLAGMLGLAGKDMQEVLAQRPGTASNALYHIPQEIIISPAIFEALNSFGGAAVAITDFDPTEDRPPAGVMVVHHGDMTMFKGLLETAFQFAPTAEKIGDMPTFTVQAPEVGQVAGVLTESLVIVGTSRDLVTGVVNRLTGAESASLGTREDLSEVASQRTGATLFAYVDLQAVLKIARATMSENDLREYAVANAICDLDSLRWATFSTGIHDGAMGFRLAVRLADGHRSLAYNLMRLPPMSRNCLRNVPPNAAAIFGLGLNPALVQATVSVAEGETAELAVTGFDIGREFFGNIQEVCAFIIPGKMGKPESQDGPTFVPNVGILMAVNDAARSKALWNQILTLPGLIGGDEPIAPKAVKIGQQEVTAYAIPDFGKVYLTELDGCIAVGVTHSALKAAIRAHNKKESILDDKIMGKVIADMPSHSSMMVVAHMGRIAEVATGTGEAGVAMWANQVAQLCPKTVAWFGLGQSPTQLTLRAAVSGLPNVNDAVKKFGPMANAMGGLIMASSKASSKASDKAPSKAPSTPSVKDLTDKLMAAAGRGDNDKALEYALEARKVADIGLTNYNVACMYSLLGQKEQAFEYLFRAAKLGMGVDNGQLIGLMERDADLDNLRGDPRFEKVRAMAKGEDVETPKIVAPAKKKQSRVASKAGVVEM